MATANPDFKNVEREPTEMQLARWDDDGGNQYIYADIIFMNGKIISGRAAHLHQIITKYWERLSQPIAPHEFELPS